MMLKERDYRKGRGIRTKRWSSLWEGRIRKCPAVCSAAVVSALLWGESGSLVRPDCCTRGDARMFWPHQWGICLAGILSGHLGVCVHACACVRACVCVCVCVCVLEVELRASYSLGRCYNN
jgi:hypothetical protein